jgi:hypothetical protein
VTCRRVTTRFPPLAISDSLRPGVYRIGYGPPCAWCYACSPSPLNTGSPTNSTTTYKTLTKTGPPPRNLLQLSGTITYAHNITLRLDRPIAPKNHLSTHPAH